jgi:hypothetical protein
LRWTLSKQVALIQIVKQIHHYYIRCCWKFYIFQISTLGPLISPNNSYSTAMNTKRADHLEARSLVSSPPSWTHPLTWLGTNIAWLAGYLIHDDLFLSLSSLVVLSCLLYILINSLKLWKAYGSIYFRLGAYNTYTTEREREREMHMHGHMACAHTLVHCTEKAHVPTIIAWMIC